MGSSAAKKIKANRSTASRHEGSLGAGLDDNVPPPIINFPNYRESDNLLVTSVGLLILTNLPGLEDHGLVWSTPS